MAKFLSTIEVTFTVTARMEIYLETQGEPLMEHKDLEDLHVLDEVAAAPCLYCGERVDECQFGGAFNCGQENRSMTHEGLMKALSTPTGHSWKLGGEYGQNYGGRFAEEPPHGQPKPGEDHR